MPQIGDLDNPPTFNKQEWIGQKKIYSQKNLPYFVVDACTQAFAVPQHEQWRFPSRDITVLDLLRTRTPIRSSALNTTKPEAWFSNDPPNIDSEALFTHKIPSEGYLKKLEGMAGQMWLDGAQSIVDPRVNDGRGRLPLWVLRFWKQMSDVSQTKADWARCERYLSVASPGSSAAVTEAFANASACLEQLGWNTPMLGLDNLQTTRELTRVIGDGWICTGIIQMMAEHLSARAKADPKVPASTVIAGPHFAVALLSALDRELPYTRKQTPLLARYEHDIKSSGRKKLYFPAHVNGCHWITVCIDFANHEYSYGDSLAGHIAPPARMMEAVGRWLNNTLSSTPPPGDISSSSVHDEMDVDELSVMEPQDSAHSLAHILDSSTHIASSSSSYSSSPQMSICSLPPIDNGMQSFNSTDYEADASSMEASSIDNNSIDAPASSLAPASPTSSIISAPSNKPLDQPTSGILGWLKGASLKKRKLPNDNVSSDSSIHEKATRKPSKQAKVAPQKEPSTAGISRTATRERKQREQVKNNVFELDPVLFERWKADILEIDGEAEVDEIAAYWVRHSACGKTHRSKRPYDRSRFKKHVGVECKSLKHPIAAAGTPTLAKFIAGAKEKSNAVNKRVSRSCPGLSSEEDPRIATYLKRTAASGGGARSVSVIAKALFQKMFRKLGRARKEEVINTQLHELRWRNEHAIERVFSTDCFKTVMTDTKDERPLACPKCDELLRLSNFKKALDIPMPEDENFRYNNKRWRPPRQLTELYGRITGLREIIETADSVNTPCVKFAKGVLGGKYKDLKVFTGLVEAMVMKTDREERGVGMQNFKYPPEYDEFIHVLNIHSPRAHRFLCEHLAARTERSYRNKESREPRMPMTICNRTFELVDSHLNAIGYTGPVGLSCDDTKLFPAWRIYWDAAQKANFLVGGTGEPMRIADPKQLRATIANAKLKQASKVRLIVAQVPMPKVAPIIVAAIPILGDGTSAEELAEIAAKVIFGLLDRGIRVVSYACDGTESERKLQRLLLEIYADRIIRHTIKNPREGCPDTDVLIGVFRGQHIVMIQDSKHGLKTFRNNLFSGARLLTLGSYTAIYRRIEEMAYEDGSPLYQRDVHKTDRQDDNAAARLFSAATLQFLADKHPKYLGEIIYLFVFGELIDAYQNRQISLRERIKMALRARYFLDYWLAYLKRTGYNESQYFISRELMDIAQFLITGLIGLIIVYRDNLDGEYPLLPWLHSSEPCEHVFGEARQIIKDFTMLDLLYMLTKLRVKLREAILNAQSANFKARANGYTHTYQDAKGINIPALLSFPSDFEINAAALEGMEECESLILLLGIQPAGLHLNAMGFYQLPGIETLPFDDSEFDDGASDSSDSDSEIGDVVQLQQLMDIAESSELKGSFTEADEAKLTRLSCAAMALINDDIATVYQLPEDDADEEQADEVFAEEYQNILSAMPRPGFKIAPLKNDSPSKPFGLNPIHDTNLDLSPLVQLRYDHQTRHAALGVRTTTHTTPTVGSASARQALIREFQAILKEQQEQSVLTGNQRKTLWQGADSGSTRATGNTANAEMAAGQAAKLALSRRKTIFKIAQVSCLAIVGSAGISQLRLLSIGDWCFVYLHSGIRLAQVITLYSKGGGKNAKHGAIPKASNVGAISYVGVQLFEQWHRHVFRATSTQTALFATKQFQHLPSIALLSKSYAPAKVSGSHFEIGSEDMNLFTILSNNLEGFARSMVISRKRGPLEAGSRGLDTILEED
ncbi:hypothetical protein HWV62_24362 [Athelia sp. TMB]|nr:hypothetical protein HWV62_24362 [Athelia sp. TMB]